MKKLVLAVVSAIAILSMHKLPRMVQSQGAAETPLFSLGKDNV